MIASCLKCHISLNLGHSFFGQLVVSDLPIRNCSDRRNHMVDQLGPDLVNDAFYGDRGCFTAADAQRSDAAL
jgi:hypothetical protein